MVYVGLVLLIVAKGLSSEKKQYEVIKSRPTPMELFLRDIAKRESNGKQYIKNKFGMLGLYQFSPKTLRSLGYTGDEQTFLSNKELQDSMMVRYLEANYKDLQKYIDRYNNKTFKGVKITQAAVLAAAHLGGSGSVIAWFNNDDHNGRTDANGTSIRDYMIQFGHHKLGVT